MSLSSHPLSLKTPPIFIWTSPPKFSTNYISGLCRVTTETLYLMWGTGSLSYHCHGRRETLFCHFVLFWVGKRLLDSTFPFVSISLLHEERFGNRSYASDMVLESWKPKGKREVGVNKGAGVRGWGVDRKLLRCLRFQTRLVFCTWGLWVLNNWIKNVSPRIQTPT